MLFPLAVCYNGFVSFHRTTESKIQYTRYAEVIAVFNRECSEQSAAARFTVIIMLSSGCHWRFGRWEGEDSEDFSQETCLMYAIVFSVGKKRCRVKGRFSGAEKKAAFILHTKTLSEGSVFFPFIGYIR